MPDPGILREAILATPLETGNFGEEPPPGTLYVPPAHIKTLRLESNLVVWARGVGKSFWTAALASRTLRDHLDMVLPDFDLLTVDLGRIDDAVVRQKVSDLVAQSRLLSMKHIFDREIRRYHSTILQPLDAERVPRDILVETLEMSIRYLSNVHRRLSTEEILSELSTVIKAERIAR